VHDLVDASRWDADVLGEPVLRQSGGFEELFEQHLAGVDGGSFVCMTAS
jgi:hypothetical protein